MADIDIDTDILDQPTAVETDTTTAAPDETSDEAMPAGEKPAKTGKTRKARTAPVRRMESWEQNDADGNPVRVERDMDTGETTVTPIGEE